LDFRLLGKVGMPKWWNSAYDYPFLIGVARYGFARADLFIEGILVSF
jgi:hypothetical protein